MKTKNKMTNKGSLFVFVVSFLLILFLSSCFSSGEKQDSFYVISTNKGDLRIKLYAETPDHKEQFEHNFETSLYDGVLVHSLIKDYALSTGNVASKGVFPNRLVPYRESEETLDAEFGVGMAKKGAIVAIARNDEQQNEFCSDAEQFMIVIGRVYTQGELDTLELNDRNKQLEIILQRLVQQNRDQIDVASRTSEIAFNRLQDSLAIEADKLLKKKELLHFSDEERLIYTTIGGLPELSRKITIFGEVVDGFDVLDQINNERVNERNFPLELIKIVKTEKD